MKIIKQGLVVMVMALVAIVGAPNLVLAQNTTGQPSPTQAQDRDEASRPQSTDRQVVAQQNQDVTQGRLQDAKLKACQNREKVIKKIMSRVADRGEKQLELFSTIADRTKTFYANKNLTIGNYDALVTEVDTKKSVAQETVRTIKSASTTFTCDSNTPKETVGSFKESLAAEIKALREYRTAVKDLIVGVKSAHDTTNTKAGDQ